MLAIAAVLAMVLVTKNRKASPAPGSVEALQAECEEMLRRLPPLPTEVTEPSNRLRSAEVRRALFEDPAGFVARQLDRKELIERGIGLVAIRQVVEQQGPEVFRDLLPLVLKLCKDSESWEFVYAMQALGALHPLDPTAVESLVRERLRPSGSPFDGVHGLVAAGVIHAIADGKRGTGSDPRDPGTETALLEAARRQPDEGVRTSLISVAGCVGSRPAAEAILARLAQPLKDDDRGELLESLGLCGTGLPEAMAKLWREAFDPDRPKEVRAGAHRGLIHAATDTELLAMEESRLLILRSDAEEDVMSAGLLARIARARGDRDLASTAAAKLILRIEPHDSRMLEVIQALLSLENLTALPREEIGRNIDEVLAEPDTYMRWEVRVELRRIRESLR